MYIYHALINALSAHMIHINLNMIFYTHVKHSPTKTIYIKNKYKKAPQISPWFEKCLARSLCLLISSIEEDFVTWREKFWPTVCEEFGVQATGEDIK